MKACMKAGKLQSKHCKNSININTGMCTIVQQLYVLFQRCISTVTSEAEITSPAPTHGMRQSHAACSDLCKLTSGVSFHTVLSLQATKSRTHNPASPFSRQRHRQFVGTVSY